MYTTKTMSQIAAELPLWNDIHQHLVKGDLSIADNPEFFKIFYPKPAYATQNIADTLRDIADERATHCFRLIDLQNDLADAGIVRARTLRNQFDYYTHHVLGGKGDKAEADVLQQELDVAIMFTLSHSQLMFAFKYAAEGDKDRLATYKMAVDIQEKNYRTHSAFVRGQDRLDRSIQVPQFSEAEIKQHRADYDLVTRDVADANERLCQGTLDLFQNQARALFHWARMMETSSSSKSLGASLSQGTDYQWEAELQEIYLQRCQILSTRGMKIVELADKVSKATEPQFT